MSTDLMMKERRYLWGDLNGQALIDEIVAFNQATGNNVQFTKRTHRHPYRRQRVWQGELYIWRESLPGHLIDELDSICNKNNDLTLPTQRSNT